MIEAACPSCRGRLIAEPGALVACPHCEQLLNIPGLEHAAAPPNLSPSDAPTAEDIRSPKDEPSFPGLPMAATVSSDSFLRAAAAAAGGEPAAQGPHAESGDLPADEGDSPADEEQPGPTTTWVPPHFEEFGPQHPAPEGSEGPAGPSRVLPPAGIPLAAESEQTSDPRSSDVETVVGARRVPVSVPSAMEPALPSRSASRRASGVPLLYFVLVCSYALLATIVLLLVFFVVPWWLRPHQLESLPDIVPPQDAQGEVPVQLYPEEAQLPPGHKLRLGETQRFGHVEVQPVRVTRGPLEFVHFRGQPADDENGFERDPTLPVLKLWVRFRNVSADQTFAPLGRALVFTRGRGKADRRMRGNNFVCPVDASTDVDDCVPVFDHVIDGEYDLKDQHIERGLQPGAEFTTYIPSAEEGLEQLTGELRWRLHFRKGLGPSGWGVTTLAEVLFHSDEVIDEGELLAGPE